MSEADREWMSRLNWIELSGEDWERFAEFQRRSDLLLASL
jgi:hypothetical protein